MRIDFAVILIGTAMVTESTIGQQLLFEEAEVHGRQAYVLENNRMRVAALQGGGHLAEIRLQSSDPRKSINPMRVPHFPTIEPWQYEPDKHDSVYGGRADRWLQAGYMGHLLNFPTFGDPSKLESSNRLGTHGEALMVRWRKQRSKVTRDAVILEYAAHLPKTLYNVGRTLTLPANETVLYIEEWVESLAAFDRPAHWVEHVTFGPPFAEPGKNVLDMPATKGEVRPVGSPSNSLQAKPIKWPIGTSYDGKRVSLREMQARPKSYTYYGVLMDQARERSYLTAYHTDYRVLVGYVWRTRDFPWLGDWQENRRMTIPPWNGEVVARGLEFGTTPFEGTMQEVVEEGTVYGVPVYRWIGGRERLTVRYVAFLAEIPEGYKGVADLEVRGGQIHITERQTGRIISLNSARDW